ncbi:hypothetical protein HPP92_005973 [Vanilla planifolia]|uniref:Cytochrome P450 n=1 Tax=Vanilla planifolia TaxID=51239 RepID=A0A835VBW0_VANPL|nr:hypothetical protein HPP92_006282 [Vanilla planifolia]KAG0494979.1 hypothetical protein HPP92_005973 [Vanilla planifolia]
MGYTVPGKSRVMVNAWDIGRDPGRRMCPGMTFAIVGMELFLAVLLFHFDWEIPEGKGPGELDVEEEFDGALRRKNDLCLMALPTESLEKRLSF